MTNIDKLGYKPVELRIYGKDKELLKQEPILCAYEIKNNKILGIGKAALEYVEDADVEVINPLKWGAVGDFLVFSKTMENFLKEIPKSFFRKPSIAMLVPAVLTEVEKIAFTNSITSSYRKIYIINKSFSQFQTEGDKNIVGDLDIYLEFVSEYYESEYYQ